MTVPVEFEERIILYVDILAWSCLVRDSKPNPDTETAMRKRDQIGRVLDHLISFHGWARHKQNPAGTEWQVALASDSLFASSPPEGRYLDQFLLETAKLAYRILLEGMFIRGALVRGPVLHNRELIVGPGVVEAVELERKAYTPRILVDEEVRALLFAEDTAQEFTYHPHDGTACFDYLGYLSYRARLSGLPAADIVPDLSRLERMLVRKREQDAGHPELDHKNDWMSGYLAHCLHVTTSSKDGHKGV